MAATAMTAEALNGITSTIIGAAIQVHQAIGPGLLESAYRACLCHEFRQRGLRFEAEKSLPLIYKGVRIARAYCADLIVEEAVVVEVKGVAVLAPVCTQQLLTYVKLADCRVGLLLNFGAPTMTAGIERVVNNFPK
jgi:GxxExxY protein